MTESEKPECIEMISAALDYYKQPVSAFILSIWWEGCKGFTLDQLARALTAHTTDPERGQFPPKVADIVRVLSGTKTDRAVIAWGKVYEAMSSVGAYQDVVFDDGIIHAVIEDMGGWPKLCRGNTDDLSYVQHRFCESYKAYFNRGGAYPKRLQGDRSPDSEYEKKGLPVPKPAIVGDIDAARIVYKTGGKAKAALSWASPVELLGNIPILKIKG